MCPCSRTPVRRWRNSSKRRASSGSRIRSGCATCWRKGSARATTPPSLTPHVLRYTFGTRWLQAGGDICKLSKILGHSSVAVTEAHYAHLLKEDLVAASRQVRFQSRREELGLSHRCLPGSDDANRMQAQDDRSKTARA